METLGQRVAQARMRKGLSQPELARAAGVSQGTIGNIESGARKQPRGLLSIASALGVRPEWLLYGLEPMEATGQSVWAVPGSDSAAQNQPGTAPAVTTHSSGSNADEIDLPPSEYVGVTKVTGAHLSAGGGEVLWEIDEVIGSHAFRQDYMLSRGLRAEKCRVWTVRGDSMEPRFCSGDVVLIDMSDRTPVHGKVYALIGDDGLRLKQLRRTQSGWEMHSFNPDQTRFPPEPIVEDNYAIIGRVRWRGGDED